MRTLAKCIILSAVVTAFFLMCGEPPANPFIPSNVKTIGEVDTLTKPLTVGDTVTIALHILVPEYADSMRVYFGDGDSVWLRRADWSDYGRDTIKHIYRSPGSFPISTTVFLNTGGKREDTPATVRIRTYLVYDGNGNTGGKVPVDTALYAKGDKVTVLANTESLERTGYVFGGWYTKQDGSGVSYNSGTKFTIDTVNVLYASWSQNPVFTITFDKNDSNATGTMAPQSIASGLSANLTRNGFIKAGSIFMGWATTASGAVVYPDSASYLMGTANVILYARWTQNTLYTITFNKNDTNATGTMATQPIASGASANLTANGFTKPGSIFSGWATTPAGTVAYTDTATYLMGTANVTLYAKWTQNASYTVTFNKNDTAATGTMGAQTIASGSSANLTANRYLKTGWFFAGWATTPTGAVSFTDAASYVMGTANVTLYAKWTQNPIYTVTFDKNDTGATGTMNPQSIASGSSANLTTNKFTKVGWTFSGWAATATGAVAYTDGASYQIGNANVTLYAKWTQNASYTVTFDKNDTSAIGTMSGQSIVSGVSATLASNRFTKAGWTFTGWATTPAGAVAYTDGTSYQMGTANVTLYAKWAQNASYTVTFNKNDTAATGTMTPQTILSGTSVTLITNEFFKTGWVFAGWATSSTGAVVYTDRTTYLMGSANVTLYAKWTQNPMFTITYVKNDSSATGTMTNQSIVGGTSVTLTANRYAKPGYTFAGWATTSNGVVAYADQASYAMGSANVTLYAKWAINSYVIAASISGSGGTISPTGNVSVVYGRDTTFIFTPAAGYVIQTVMVDGVADAAAKTAKQKTFTNVTTAHTIMVTFAPKQYTLTTNIIADYGTVTGTITQNPTASLYDSGTTVTLIAPTDNKYTFTGWTGGMTGTAYSIEVPMNGNKTMTANYSIKKYTLTVTKNPTNGGTVTVSPATGPYNHGTSVSLTAADGTGYSFGSWSVDAGGTGRTISVVMDGNKNVTATFNPVYCTVTFDGQGATGSMVNQSIQVGTSASLNAITYTRSGLTFDGWATTPTGAVDYANRASYSMGSVNVTLYAKWSVKDIDGNVYDTVKIGNQVWMVQNLKTTKLNDGTAIPLVTDDTIWSDMVTPAYSWVDDDVAKRTPYGAVYNWYTVNTGKLAPAGWHIPTTAEWSTLNTFLGGETVAGGKLKEAGTEHWFSGNSATNESGFSALPTQGGYYGFIWSATEGSATTAYDESMLWDRNDVYLAAEGKNRHMSVRCLKN